MGEWPWWVGEWVGDGGPYVGEVVGRLWEGGPVSRLPLARRQPHAHFHGLRADASNRHKGALSASAFLLVWH